MRYYTNIRTKLVVLSMALLLAVSQIACGKESIEKSIAITVRSIKAARQITTEQAEYGHITDAEYASRLKLFRSLYISVDALGDKITKFGEINATNKPEILSAIREVNGQVIALISTGNLGVKNPDSKAKFSKWILLASGTLSSIELAIAASKKPVNTSDVQVEKLGQ